MLKTILAFLVALIGVVRDSLNARERKQERQAGEDNLVRTAREAQDARIAAAEKAERDALAQFDRDNPA